MTYFDSRDPALLFPPLPFSFFHQLTSVFLAVVSASTISPTWTLYVLFFAHFISFIGSSYVASGYKGVYLVPNKEDRAALQGEEGEKERGWKVAALEVAAVPLRVFGTRLNGNKPWVWMVMELSVPLLSFAMTPASRHSSFAAQKHAASRLMSLTWFTCLAGLSMLTTPDLQPADVLVPLVGVGVEAYRQVLVKELVDDLEEAEGRKEKNRKTREQRAATVLWSTSLPAVILQASAWVGSLYIPDRFLPSSPSTSSPPFLLSISAIILLAPAYAFSSFSLHVFLSDPLAKQASTLFPLSFAYNLSFAFVILLIGMFGPSDERDGTVLMPLFTCSFAAVTMYTIFTRRKGPKPEASNEQDNEEQGSVAKPLLSPSTPPVSDSPLPASVPPEQIAKLRLLALSPVVVPLGWSLRQLFFSSSS